MILKIICDTCEGHGWITKAEHDPACNGNCENYMCPVSVQAECPGCNGERYRQIEIPDGTPIIKMPKRIIEKATQNEITDAELPF